MSETGAIAKRIVEQYGRDGRLSNESVALAQFGVWDRVTPGMLLVLTGYLAALEDPELVKRTRASGNEVMAKILQDDTPFGALALAEAGVDFRWDHLVDWIWTYWQSRVEDPSGLDALLQQAEEVWTEAVD